MKSLILLIAFTLAGTAHAENLTKDPKAPAAEVSIWQEFMRETIQIENPMCSPAGSFCVPPMGDCCSGICTGYYDDNGNAINGICG